MLVSMMLTEQARRALALLSPAEQEGVLRYHFAKDAKMALASALLKKLIIAKYCHLKWDEVVIEKDPRGRPRCLSNAATSAGRPWVDFNVSHQAGVVCIVAVVLPRLDRGEGASQAQYPAVGTDIVCVGERRTMDWKTINDKGFAAWVGIFSDVFAPDEVDFIKSGWEGLGNIAVGSEITPAGRETLRRCDRSCGAVDVEVCQGETGIVEMLQLGSEQLLDLKRRRFYAMWCLREAYVKMTGEALGAPWLRELSLGRPEVPASRPAEVSDSSLTRGQTVRHQQITVHGQAVVNVEMDLTAFGPDFMIATSIQNQPAVTEYIGDWQQLNLEQDVLETAEASR